eukprot:TRINITY_DN21196_c0_g1_i2.p1 TRINITY_DN21196_c0_g1~~TRINITY_DN21196_c0_g1_i2.p1  ORF type:complete len:974 (+),score=170.71 TRINITY_DN21196_c0_g1_i2:301-2922(+)
MAELELMTIKTRADAVEANKKKKQSKQESEDTKKTTTEDTAVENNKEKSSSEKKATQEVQVKTEEDKTQVKKEPTTDSTTKPESNGQQTPTTTTEPTTADTTTTKTEEDEVKVEEAESSDDEDEKAFREAFAKQMKGIEVKEVDLEKNLPEDNMEVDDNEAAFSARKTNEMYYEGDDLVINEESEEQIGIPRELKRVDHQKMFDEGYYVDFTKNMFILTKELQNLTEDEVKKIRKENDSTKVKDPLKKCPPPITRWDQAGLPDTVFDIIKKLNYVNPFAIQAQALPVIMSGRDVLGCACTGSGKTLSFLLPMLRHILAQEPLREGDGPIGLILGPTRELVIQIHTEVKKFAKPLSLKSVCVYGGAPIAEQIADFKRKPHIACATPGRMTDMLIANRGKVTNLRRVTYLVFDEADRMFDMGFGQQVEKLVLNIRPDRQTVMFSATFPKQVEAAAKTILHDPVEITIGGRSHAATNVSQYVELFDNDEVKFLRLLQILGEWVDKGLIIVFVDTQNECDDLYQDLVTAGWTGILELHGGMDQIDREYTLYDFKKHNKKVLVATSVAARGLDIIDLELVINYKCPNHYEDYVHRVGRTGRAGKKGTAYTFFMRETDDKMAMELVKALEGSGNDVPEELQAIAAAFWDKAKLGLVIYHKGGYGGSGYKFNNAEGRKKKEEIKKQAKALGLVGEVLSDSSDDEIGDADDIGSRAATRAAQEKAAQLSGGMTKMIGHNQKTMGAQLAVAQAVSFAVALTTQDALAREKAERGHFTAEVEINDYPQKARWKVTNREAMGTYAENYDVQVSTKGMYTQRGKPPQGQRKLYLLIEGESEKSVRDCKRYIEDELNSQMAELASRGPERSAFGNLPGTGRARLQW